MLFRSPASLARSFPPSPARPPENILAKKKQPEGPVAAAPAKKGGRGWMLWATLGLAAAGGGAYFLLAEAPPAALPEPPVLP